MLRVLPASSDRPGQGAVADARTSLFYLAEAYVVHIRRFADRRTRFLLSEVGITVIGSLTSSRPEQLLAVTLLGAAAALIFGSGGSERRRLVFNLAQLAATRPRSR